MAKKILLADDSITIQKVIELTFSDEDFDVVTVGNGRLALERLPEVRPDIVLCDIIMPEKDGYEVCEQIKANPATGHIPVLLLTGAFEPFDQERAAKAGYDGSLAKPFEPETLIAKVKDLLAKAPRPLVPPPLPTTGPMPVVATGSVLPATPPSAPPAVPTARVAPPPPSGAPSFIPDEPFSGLDTGAFEAEPSSGPAAPAVAPPLAAISVEESDTLSIPPEEVAEEVVEDSSATMIYRRSEAAWEGGPTAAPPPSSAAPAPEAAAGEAPVFEAVLEEDLDFGPGDFASGQGAGRSGASTAFPASAGTMPPVAEVEEGTSGPFAALVREPSAEEPIEKIAANTAEFPRSTAVEEELLEPEPFPPTPPPQRPIFEEPPVRTPEAVRPVAVVPPAEPPPFVVPPLPRPAAAVPVPAPQAPAPPRVPPVPIVRPVEPPLPPPVRSTPPSELSKPAGRPASLLEASPARAQQPPLAEFRPKAEVHSAPLPVVPAVVASVPAPPASRPPIVAQAVPGEAVVPAAEPSRPSEAGAVSVPADMVEKIAQRVIAQISEKIVREVAWEVIPDLAESLIKREIERLKAELAKI